MLINKKRWIYLIPLLVVMGAQLATVHFTMQPQVKITGKKVPPFFLPDLLGPQPFFTSADLPNDVILFNIWASWCIACQQEHPILMKIKEKYHVPVYGLNLKDNRTSALQWLAVAGNPYRQIGTDPTGALSRYWGLIGIPETFLIDSSGTVRFQYRG